MMLAMVGRPSEVDYFHYVLAEKLGKSVAEILEFPNSEILGWRAYYVSRNAATNQKRVI